MTECALCHRPIQGLHAATWQNGVRYLLCLTGTVPARQEPQDCFILVTVFGRKLSGRRDN